VAEGVAEASEAVVAEPAGSEEVELALAGEPVLQAVPVEVLPRPAGLVGLAPELVGLVDLAPVPVARVERLPESAALVDLVSELVALVALASEPEVLVGRVSVLAVSLPAESVCVVVLSGWGEARHFVRQPYWELRGRRFAMVSRASIRD